MRKKLDLTDEQVKKVSEINLRYANQMEKTSADKKSQRTNGLKRTGT